MDAYGTIAGNASEYAIDILKRLHVDSAVAQNAGFERIPGDRTASPERPQFVEADMSDTDVVIIGAGHNGLTCAAYLAMAGLRVKVVERRKVVGGAAVTEEFHPGFRNSVAAYTVSLLNPQIIADLKLRRSRPEHRRAPRAEFPARAGRQLSPRPAKAAPRQSVAKLSARDADRLDAFSRELEAIADVLRRLRAARAAESRRRLRRRRDPRGRSTRSAPPTSCAA